MAHDHSHRHEANCGHPHGHGHGLSPEKLDRAFVAAEVAAGLWAGSLALLADAGHNAGDVLGLLLAWGASWLARRPPSRRYTWGLRRSTIYAALANAVLLLVAVGVVCREAVLRLGAPTPVPGVTVIAVAAVGVLVNGASAMMFHRSQKTDANARGAFLHLVSDALVSLCVVVAGLVMWRTHLWWLDPAMSLAVSLVIVGGAWSLLKEALDLSLDAVPRHIKIAAVEEYLLGLPDVRGVHDLHVWSLSTTDVAMTAHLVMPAAAATRAMQRGVVDAMRTRFGIGHTTLQVEDLAADGEPDADCQHADGCRPTSP